jgi:Tfp pilus assembly protein PilZ
LWSISSLLVARLADEEVEVRGGAPVESRVEPRFKKRIPCKLKQGQGTFAGMILDVSRTGLFVRTSAAAKPGEQVDVVLSSGERIELSAQVVWQQRVPPRLRSVAEGGLGLKIRYAPEPYFALLAEAARGSAPASERSV